MGRVLAIGRLTPVRIRRTTLSDRQRILDNARRDENKQFSFVLLLDGTLEGAPVVLIGSGGAAQAILFALAQIGSGPVTIFARNALKGAALLARFGLKGEVKPLGATLPPATLLVNASPLGMKGQPPLDLDLASLPDDAIVYDIVLKRYGKIKITHRDCFQWNYPNIYGDTTYDMLANVTPDQMDISVTYDSFASQVNLVDNEKESFVFIQGDGTVLRLDFSLDSGNTAGVILLGKYQFQRNYFLTHLGTEFETANDGDNVVAKLIYTLNGKDPEGDPMTMFELPRRNKSKLRKWNKLVSGKNISILLTGSYNLTTGIIVFTTGGTG